MNKKSFTGAIFSLKDTKTTILCAQNTKMLQRHVNNDIYNKYYLIHNTSFDFLDPRSHRLFIVVGNKFSTNNRSLEFHVLIRLCMCSCRLKYARRIYIMMPIKLFSQRDLSPFSYLLSMRHQRMQYLFICEKSFDYCYCIFSSILVCVLQKHISHWGMPLLLLPSLLSLKFGSGLFFFIFFYFTPCRILSSEWLNLSQVVE